jgi:ABC-2 type transport system permease protein
MIAVAMRMRGLLTKEILQILRDPSALLIAFLLPVVLLLVNGFGISLDARHMRVAVLIEAPAEPTREILQALGNSPYLEIIRVNSTTEGQRLMTAGEARGMLVMREDFVERLMRSARWPASAQLLLNGTDPNTARVLEGYVQGAIMVWLSGSALEHRIAPTGGVSVEHRYWFNPELRSADFIVPGMIAFVMSMTGTLLTALIVAREWERGTMEAMLASPARMVEMMAAKLGCYFVLGMTAMLGAVVMAILIFGVPFRGSVLALLAAATLFLIFALALGLFISTLARNQFVAAQTSFLVTMLPAMMLSGMLFDIASMPGWLQTITYAVPARYLVSILQTLFLAGTVWALILPNLAGLAVAATLAVGATLMVTRRRLD